MIDAIRRRTSPAILAAFAIVVAMLFVEVARWVRVPVFLDNTEIYLGFGSRSLADDGVLYRDLSRLPLVVHVYQPLAYLPSATMLKISGVTGADWLPVARLPNLPVLALTLGVLLAIARRLSRSTEAALLATTAVIYLHAAFFPEILRIRPENGAMLFTLAALLLALARPRGWEVWAGLAVAAANFFKPTFVALPAAIVLRLLLEKDLRGASTFAAVCAAAFASMAAAAAATFGADYVTQTMRLSAANPDLPLWKAPVLLLVWLRLFGPAFALLAVGALAHVRREGATAFLPLYLVLCSVLSVLGLTKTGADIHYLIELSFVVLFCFLAGLPDRGRLRLLAALCILAVGYQWHRTGTPAVRFCAHRHAGYLACDYTSPLPAAPAAARDVAFRDPHAVVLDEVLAFESGKVTALDWTLLDLLVRAGALDPAPLVEALRAPSTTRIVFPRRATAFLEDLYQGALREGFRPAEGTDGRVLERVDAPPLPPLGSGPADRSIQRAFAAERIPKRPSFL